MPESSAQSMAKNRNANYEADKLNSKASNYACRPDVVIE